MGTALKKKYIKENDWGERYYRLLPLFLENEYFFCLHINRWEQHLLRRLDYFTNCLFHAHRKWNFVLIQMSLADVREIPEQNITKKLNWWINMRCPHKYIILCLSLFFSNTRAKTKKSKKFPLLFLKKKWWTAISYRSSGFTF